MNRKRTSRKTFSDTSRQRNVMFRTEPLNTKSEKRTTNAMGPCAICLTTVSQQKLRYDCDECQKIICTECLRRYAKCAVLDRGMLPLRCPSEKCNSPIPYGHLMNVLNAKQYRAITKPPTIGTQQRYVPMSTEDLHNYQKLMKLATANGWKNCPGCNALVAKNGGCSTIYCRCGRSFDWFSTKSNVYGGTVTLGAVASAIQGYHRPNNNLRAHTTSTTARTNPLPSSKRASAVPQRQRGHKSQSNVRNRMNRPEAQRRYDSLPQHVNYGSQSPQSVQCRSNRRRKPLPTAAQTNPLPTWNRASVVRERPGVHKSQKHVGNTVNRSPVPKLPNRHDLMPQHADCDSQNATYDWRKTNPRCIKVRTNAQTDRLGSARRACVVRAQRVPKPERRTQKTSSCSAVPTGHDALRPQHAKCEGSRKKSSTERVRRCSQKQFGSSGNAGDVANDDAVAGRGEGCDGTTRAEGKQRRGGGLGKEGSGSGGGLFSKRASLGVQTRSKAKSARTIGGR